MPVKVQDLSLKGALLRLGQTGEIAPGAPCLLEVKLGELRIAMAAEVAHVEGTGSQRKAGLLCRSIDIESITHLRRLIEINTGDPRLLERELKALIQTD